MKRNVEKYDYQVLNDAKNILMEIDMPKELYNPRCYDILCMCPDDRWKIMEAYIRRIYECP